MDQPIMLTPRDIVSFFLAFCGAIITVTAAFAAVTKIISALKKPEKTQDERIDALEKEIKDIRERLSDGNDRFDSESNRVSKLERDMKETNKIIMISLQALTANAIDGNNTEKLLEAKRTLDGYLIDHL